MTLNAVTVASMFYLSLFVALTLSLAEGRSDADLVKRSLHRWARLLGGLVGIGLVVQILTWLS